MRIKLKIFLLFFTFAITGCDYSDNRLIIYNESAANVFVSFSKDTLLNLYEDKTFEMPDYYIKANDKSKIVEPGSTKAWEFLAEKSLNKELHIFFIKEDVIKRYKPTEIINNKLFEKRIDISIDELKKNNWQVTYR